MTEVNENGRSNVHEAAYRGYVKSVEKFIEKFPDQLEFETQDEYHATPFLLACQGGHKECVELLISIGANVVAKDRYSRGAVEISAIYVHLHILKYFAELNNPKLNVWRNLLSLVLSDSEDDHLAAAKALDALTINDGESQNIFSTQAVEAGLVTTSIKVLRGPCGPKTRTFLTNALINVTRVNEKSREQVLTCGILPAVCSMLRSEHLELIATCGTFARQLLEIVPETFVDAFIQANFLPDAVYALQNAPTSRAEAVVPLIDSIGLIASFSANHQNTVAQTTDLTTALARHFSGHSLRDVFTSLLIAVTRIVLDNSENQVLVANSPGIVNGILALTKLKNRELQLAAVSCLTSLGDRQPECQKKLAEAGALVALMQLLKKARADEIREQTVIALWALAGTTLEEKRSVATLIGVHLLVELLGAKSEVLVTRVCEALETLCLGPHNKQGAIGATPGIWRLTPLITAHSESKSTELMKAALRAFRALLMGPGYSTHKRNQDILVDKRFLEQLVDYTINHPDPIIKSEAANTVAASIMGNKTNEAMVKDIFGTSPSSNENLTEKEKIEKAAKANGPRLAVVSLMNLLFGKDRAISAQAGHSLATLAFNSLERQHGINTSGGLRVQPFASNLKSSESLQKIDTAFQIVVLSRQMRDTDPSAACAQSIHILAQIITSSRHSDDLYLAADVVCRLLRLKSGVGQALVAVGIVNILCKLLLSHADLVRGAAAIALGLLTKQPLARRQLLRRCIQDPFLVDVLQFYNDKKALSQDFVDSWHHARVIGLPPVAHGRLSLLNAEQGSLQMRPVRPQMNGDVQTEQAAIDDVAKANEASNNVENFEENQHEDNESEDDVELPEVDQSDDDETFDD